MGAGKKEGQVVRMPCLFLPLVSPDLFKNLE